jgi:hypothetical protein
MTRALIDCYPSILKVPQWMSAITISRLVLRIRLDIPCLLFHPVPYAPSPSPSLFLLLGIIAANKSSNPFDNT